MAVPPFAWFLPPGFHVAIFFVVFFCITHDRLSKRGTTRSLLVTFSQEHFQFCLLGGWGEGLHSIKYSLAPSILMFLTPPSVIRLHCLIVFLNAFVNWECNQAGFFKFIYSSTYCKLSGKGSTSYSGKHFCSCGIFNLKTMSFWTCSSGCKLWNISHFGNSAPLFSSLFDLPKPWNQVYQSSIIEGEMFQEIWTRIVQCAIKITESSGSLIHLWIIKHLMTDLKGNCEVSFSKNLNIKVERNQNSLFPVGQSLINYLL